MQRALAACLGVSLLPAPVPAVTLDEVRDLLVSQSGASGVIVDAGGARREGELLILSDVVLRAAGEGFSVSQAVDEVRLRDLGEGRVEVTASPEARIVGRAGNAVIEGKARQQGLRIELEGPARSPAVTLALGRMDLDLSAMPSGEPGERGRLVARLEDVRGARVPRDGLPAAATAALSRLVARFEASGRNGSAEADLDLSGLGFAIDLDLPPALRAAIEAGPAGPAGEPDLRVLAGASMALRAGLDALSLKVAGRGGEGVRGELSARLGGFRSMLDLRAGDRPVAVDALPGAELAFETAVGSYDLAMDASDPTRDERVRLKIGAGGGTTALAATIPEGLSERDFVLGPPEGIAARLILREDALAIDLAMDTAAARGLSGHLSRDSARAELSYGDEGVGYDIGMTGLDVALATPDLPVPVAFSLPELALVFGVPLRARPEPQPARMRIDLRDLRLADSLWSVFDPQALLPRDPIRLTLDADALLTVIGNVFAPVTAGASPYRADAVNLRELALTGLGAAVSGSGDVRLSYPDGPDRPEPDGAFRFRATGVYALIDRLQALGLLKADEIASLRMGLAFIAKPAGNDVLKSDIRLGPKAGVTLNGMKVK